MQQTESNTILKEASAKPRVAGAFILSGGLKSPDLVNRFGLPIPCLPQDSNRYAIDVWGEAFVTLGLDPDAVFVMTDEAGSVLWARADRSPKLIRDKAPYRGPAGVLHDACAQIAPEGPCLVIEHSRMLSSPGLLKGFVGAHAAGGNAITVATNPDGTFSGVLIAEPEVIDIIPGIGFMDTKEQWLPAAHANGFPVSRAPLGGWCYQIRSRSAYLDAMKQMGAFGNPLEQGITGRSADGIGGSRYGGALIATGAQVSPSASIAHSVVCGGAEIGERAVVVRSIIGPGARVANDATVIDSTVKAAQTGR